MTIWSLLYNRVDIVKSAYFEVILIKKKDFELSEYIEKDTLKKCG